MQNYFKNRKKKRRRRLASACLCIAAALAFAWAWSKGLGFHAADSGTAFSNMLYTAYADGDAVGENDRTGDDKMNNTNDKNSKNSSKAENMSVYGRDMGYIVVKTGGEIRQMFLEDYVLGCVLGEMPSGFELEALMAQSIAVRTFAVRGMSGYSKHKDADICTDYKCCQSYKNPNNVSAQTRDKVKSAVTATKGIIATYEGQPILAAYHSSSGENTLSSKQVWGGDLPYLVSTPSPEGETAVSAFGNGHRVGMSQHGANLLAKEGKSFAQILSYYYKGISLDFVKTM